MRFNVFYFKLFFVYLFMPRCKVCNIKFETKYFLQKTCLNENCILTYSKELKLKEWEKQSKKQNNKPKVKKKTVKEYLQTDINKLARLIDKHFNYKCIDCGKTMKVVHGAHFKNVGGNENIRYNLHNIHSARAYCNVYSSEHKKGYVEGIKKRYGNDYLELLENGLKSKYTFLGLKENELKEALKQVRICIRQFNSLILGCEDGKEAREMFNKKIGIYK